MRRTNPAQRRADNNDPEANRLWGEIRKEIDEIEKTTEEIKKVKEKMLSIDTKWANGATKTHEDADEFEKLVRRNISLDRHRLKLLHGSDGEDGNIAKIQILNALKSDNTQSTASRAPPKRGNNNLTSTALGGDVDGAADSAASSPAMDSKPRNARPQQKTSSQPPKVPKESSVKREDSEVPEVPAKTGKVVFAMDAEVAFKPKSPNGEETDWILGKVVKVIGEGKSRRYDVQDPEPDEKTGKQAIIRTFASNMVTIPPLEAPLPEYPIGKGVLARYPDTTTFYRATVAGHFENKVMLKFEGEDDQEKTMNVDRRFVLDHRG